MPRNRPGRMRAGAIVAEWDRTSVAVLGQRIVADLARLEREDLHPSLVADALAEWRHLSRCSASELAPPWGSDYVELIGPDARDVLERAFRALPATSRRRLSRQVMELDAAVQRVTLIDPHKPTGLPWWRRMLVH